MKTLLPYLSIFVLLIACNSKSKKTDLYIVSNETEIVHQIDSSKQWSQFRGSRASGVDYNSKLPAYWKSDSIESMNIKWKTSIPGLGHSCPSVWDDKIFITTAVSDKEQELKIGLYGDIDAIEDDGIHQFKLICIDKKNGEVIWEKIAVEGIPKTKRHTKASHANCTPATNGEYIVAFFGSEGLYCYDMEGNLKWQRDFGELNSGPYHDAEIEWGYASSPIIHENSVVIQCDVTNQQSFIASLNLETGEDIWRIEREDFATWSTPTIFEYEGNVQVLVNGFKHMGAYDFNTGKVIWKMNGGGDAPVPAPVVAHNHIFINNAHGKKSPIYVIKPNAIGDITLPEDSLSNEYILWSIKRGGAYMQTPLIYGDYLYNCRGNGQLTCYNALTGDVIYKEKLKTKGITASGVAADGKLYFSCEDGTVYVVKAGSEFELLATNHLNEICMATPAIDDNTIFFRTDKSLIAVSEF